MSRGSQQRHELYRYNALPAPSGAAGVRSSTLGLPQFFHGSVLRSVVDDDDFEAGIFETKQSPDAADD
jgi:hypothetical protein